METLLAVATLAIGMLFIGGTFMTGVYFASLSTERTIASVAADEAFAKIQLYGNPPVEALSTTTFVLYEPGNGLVGAADVSDRVYPSVLNRVPDSKKVLQYSQESQSSQYSWAAVCKRVSAASRLAEFTVFICRRSGEASLPTAFSDLPRPVRVDVGHDSASPNNELQIAGGLALLRDGTSILDDATGQIYRVVERVAGQPSQPDKIKLDRPWTGGATGRIWLIPSAAGGRDPLVAIYQQILRF
jgi:hypothetical protein